MRRLWVWNSPDCLNYDPLYIPLKNVNGKSSILKKVTHIRDINYNNFNIVPFCICKFENYSKVYIWRTMLKHTYNQLNYVYWQITNTVDIFKIYHLGLNPSLDICYSIFPPQTISAALNQNIPCMTTIFEQQCRYCLRSSLRLFPPYLFTMEDITWRLSVKPTISYLSVTSTHTCIFKHKHWTIHINNDLSIFYLLSWKHLKVHKCQCCQTCSYQILQTPSTKVKKYNNLSIYL